MGEADGTPPLPWAPAGAIRVGVPSGAQVRYREPPPLPPPPSPQHALDTSREGGRYPARTRGRRRHVVARFGSDAAGGDRRETRSENEAGATGHRDEARRQAVVEQDKIGDRGRAGRRGKKADHLRQARVPAPRKLVRGSGRSPGYHRRKRSQMGDKPPRSAADNHGPAYASGLGVTKRHRPQWSPRCRRGTPAAPPFHGESSADKGCQEPGSACPATHRRRPGRYFPLEPRALSQPVEEPPSGPPPSPRGDRASPPVGSGRPLGADALRTRSECGPRARRRLVKTAGAWVGSLAGPGPSSLRNNPCNSGETRPVQGWRATPRTGGARLHRRRRHRDTHSLQGWCNGGAGAGTPIP